MHVGVHTVTDAQDGMLCLPQILPHYVTVPHGDHLSMTGGVFARQSCGLLPLMYGLPGATYTDRLPSWR